MTFSLAQNKNQTNPRFYDGNFVVDKRSGVEGEIQGSRFDQSIGSWVYDVDFDTSRKDVVEADLELSDPKNDYFALVSDDGYLKGWDDAGDGFRPDASGDTIVRVEEVPQTLADRIDDYVNGGNKIAQIRDGYDAWSLLSKFNQVQTYEFDDEDIYGSPDLKEGDFVLYSQKKTEAKRVYRIESAYVDDGEWKYSIEPLKDYWPQATAWSQYRFNNISSIDLDEISEDELPKIKVGSKVLIEPQSDRQNDYMYQDGIGAIGIITACFDNHQEDEYWYLLAILQDAQDGSAKAGMSDFEAPEGYLRLLDTPQVHSESQPAQDTISSEPLTQKPIQKSLRERIDEVLSQLAVNPTDPQLNQQFKDLLIEQQEIEIKNLTQVAAALRRRSGLATAQSLILASVKRIQAKRRRLLAQSYTGDQADYARMVQSVMTTLEKISERLNLMRIPSGMWQNAIDDIVAHSLLGKIVSQTPAVSGNMDELKDDAEWFVNELLKAYSERWQSEAKNDAERAAESLVGLFNKFNLPPASQQEIDSGSYVSGVDYSNIEKILLEWSESIDPDLMKETDKFASDAQKHFDSQASEINALFGQLRSKPGGKNVVAELIDGMNPYLQSFIGNYQKDFRRSLQNIKPSDICLLLSAYYQGGSLDPYDFSYRKSSLSDYLSDRAEEIDEWLKSKQKGGQQ